MAVVVVAVVVVAVVVMAGVVVAGVIAALVVMAGVVVAGVVMAGVVVAVVVMAGVVMAGVVIAGVRGHIDKFCLQVHNFEKNEDKQMILIPNERSFYLAPDDISFCNIITVPFDTEPPPTDDLLDAVSKEVSSLVSAPRKNSILHIFVCLVTVALEVILEFWKKEEIARSKIWAIRRMR